jgi:hypothetical protein
MKKRFLFVFVFLFVGINFPLTALPFEADLLKNPKTEQQVCLLGDFHIETEDERLNEVYLRSFMRLASCSLRHVGVVVEEPFYKIAWHIDNLAARDKKGRVALEQLARGVFSFPDDWKDEARRNAFLKTALIDHRGTGHLGKIDFKQGDQRFLHLLMLFRLDNYFSTAATGTEREQVMHDYPFLAFDRITLGFFRDRISAHVTKCNRQCHGRLKRKFIQSLNKVMHIFEGEGYTDDMLFVDAMLKRMSEDPYTRLADLYPQITELSCRLGDFDLFSEVLNDLKEKDVVCLVAGAAHTRFVRAQLIAMGFVSVQHITNLDLATASELPPDLALSEEQVFGLLYKACACSAEEPEGVDAAVEACDYCGGIPETLLVCSRCGSVRYCNRKCQRSHWKKHKTFCNQHAKKNNF